MYGLSRTAAGMYNVADLIEKRKQKFTDRLLLLHFYTVVLNVHNTNVFSLISIF